MKDSTCVTVLAIILLDIFCVLPMQAQQGNTLFDAMARPAPETYAALKMEDYNHVTNSGSSTVKFKVGELRAEGHFTEVNLAYSLQGIRAAEVSGVAGLGWNLGIGASLVRTVNGKPDESTFGLLKEPERARVVMKVFNGNFLIDNTPITPSEGSTFVQAWPARYDAGPDVFSYVVDGVSGQFRFTRSGSISHLPIKNIKVAKAVDLSWIEITSPSGLVYRFGGSDGLNTSVVDASNLRAPVGTRGPDAEDWDIGTTSKWHLTSIKDPAGRVLVSIQYKRAEYIVEKVNDGVQRRSVITCADCQGSYRDELYRSDNYYVGQIDPRTQTPFFKRYTVNYFPIIIRNEFTNRSVTFQYDLGREDVLSENSSFSPLILRKVITNDGYKSKTYQLFHNYTGVSGSADQWYDKRLILDSIRLIDYALEVQRTIAFSYEYDKSPNGRYVSPSRLSPGVDHWGFFNTLASGSRNMLDRFPLGRHYAMDYNANTYIAIEHPTGSGIDRNPTIIGSKHGSIKRYTDSDGWSVSYTYGQHIVKSFIPPVPTGNATIKNSIYGCAVEGTGCDRANCVYPIEMAYDCPTIPSDPKSTVQDVVVDFAMAPNFRITLNEFELDSRSPNNRNVRCNEPWPRDPNRTRYSARVDVWYQGRNWYRILGPTLSRQQVWFSLQEMFPLVAFPSSGTATIRIAVNAVHGTIGVDHYEYTQEITPPPQVRNVGGIRIEAVSIQDMITGATNLTNYTYLEPSNMSSGRLLQEPIYGYQVSDQGGCQDYCSIY